MNPANKSLDTGPDWRESWPRLVSLVDQPTVSSNLSTTEFEELLAEMSGAGLLPLFHQSYSQGRPAHPWPEEHRQALDRRILSCKTSGAVLWAGLDHVLGILEKDGSKPILLKGSHLAFAYYKEPFLRPMGDIDLCFPDLSEAERAQALLLKNGFELSGPTWRWDWDPWSYHFHLPALVQRATRLFVEIHGSVFYAPKDKKYPRALCLLNETEDLTICVHNVKALRPEANVVYLSAHTFEPHPDMKPRPIYLYDVQNILQKESGRFAWDRLEELARQSGFTRATALGLRTLEEIKRVSIPATILASLNECALEEQAATGKQLSEAGRRTQQTLDQIETAGGFMGPFRLGLHLLLPPAQFMRERYHEKGGWPLFFLYPYRWCGQFGLLFSLLKERALGPKSKKPSVSGE